MDEKKNELLPCPFCGGPVELEKAAREPYGPLEWWGVICRNTLNLGGTCAIYQIPSASKEAAVERWNRRAPAERLYGGAPGGGKSHFTGRSAADDIKAKVLQRLQACVDDPM